MGKDVIERIKLDLLFEEKKNARRFDRKRLKRIIIRSAVLFMIISLAVCIWAVSVSGMGDGNIGGGTSEDTGEDLHGSVSETERESESDSDSDTVEDGSGIMLESGTESASENETQGSSEQENGIIGLDMSQLEKGDGYIVNFSDKAIDANWVTDRGFIERETAGGAAPLVLIIHTHTSEEYMRGDSGYRGPSGVVSVGDALNSRLNSLGVGAVHCSVIHDGDRGDAYRAARETVSTMLEIYPSIKYVIDLHRAEMESDGVLIKTVSGCSDGSAQIRLTVSADRSDFQEDLALALALRKSLNRNGERVCMPVTVSSIIPNGDLCKYMITAEVGSSANTVEEAMAAGKRLGLALADVLLG